MGILLLIPQLSYSHISEETTDYTFVLRLRLAESCNSILLEGTVSFNGNLYPFTATQTSPILLNETFDLKPSNMDFDISLTAEGCTGDCTSNFTSSFLSNSCEIKSNGYDCGGLSLLPKYYIEAYWHPTNFKLSNDPSPTTNSRICPDETITLSVPGPEMTHTWSYKIGSSTDFLNFRETNTANPSVQTSVKQLLGSDYQNHIDENLYFRVTAGACEDIQVDPYVIKAAPINLDTADITGTSCNDSSDGKILIESQHFDRSLLLGESLTITLYKGTDFIGQASNNTMTFEFTDLQDGDYRILVESSMACNSSEYFFSIPSPDPITVSSNISDLDCSGKNGSVKIDVQGGTSSYSYSWTGPDSFSSTNEDLSGLETEGTYSVTINDANGCELTKSFTIKDPSITATYEVTHLDCEDQNGLIELGISGGSGSYAVLWTGPDNYSSTEEDIYGLTSPGYYTFLVEDDNGCTFEDSVLVEKITFDLSYVLTNVSCNGNNDGAISLSISSGSGSFEVQWSGPDGFTGTSTNITDLSPGNYYLSVTDINTACTKKDTILITEPDPLNVTLNSLNDYNNYDISCYGFSDGAVEAQIVGGTPDYSFSWPGYPEETTSQLSDLEQGNYSINVSDANGCEASTSITLNQPDSVEISLGFLSRELFNGYDLSCHESNDGQVEANVSGGVGPYDYTWSSDPLQFDSVATDLASDVLYEVSVRDQNGCTSSRDFSLTAPDPINITFNIVEEISCRNYNDGVIHAEVSGGVTSYNYLWKDDNTLSGDTLTQAGKGWHVLTITDQNKCEQIDSVELTDPPGINIDYTLSDYNGYELRCYSDSSGFIDLTVSGEYNSLSYEWSTGITDEDIFDVPAGQYYVTVTDDRDCQYNKEFNLVQPDQMILSSVLKSSYNGFNTSCYDSDDGSIRLNVEGGTGTYEYIWNGSTGSQDEYSLNGGDYSIQIYDQNSCSIDTVIEMRAPDPIVIESILSDYNGYNVSCKDSYDGYIDINAYGGVGLFEYKWSNKMVTEDLNSIGQGDYLLEITDENSCNATDSFKLEAPPLLEILELTTEDLLCYGEKTGKIFINAAGGVDTLMYSLDGGLNFSYDSEFDSLEAGDYEVLVTDRNNCIEDTTATLTQPSQILITVDSLAESECDQPTGYIQVKVEGGNPGYLLEWFDSDSIYLSNENYLSDMSAGLYQLVVTDNNDCIVPKTFGIPSEQGPQVKIVEQNDVTCYGYSDANVRLEITSDTTYTVEWPDGDESLYRDSLSAGNYLVNVTDHNSCVTFADIQINSPDPINYNIIELKIPSCKSYDDGSIKVEGTGGNGGYVYTWPELNSELNQVENLKAGNYELHIADSIGCKDVFHINIQEPDTLVYTVEALTDPSCFKYSDGTISLNAIGGKGPYAYEWENFTKDTSNLTNVKAGSYSFYITDSLGCVISDSIYLGQPDSLYILLESIIDPSCYGHCDGSIKAKAVGGTPSYSFLWSNSDLNSEIGDLCAGSYWIEVTDQNQCNAIDTVQLTDPEPLTVEVGDSALVCLGQSYSLTAGIKDVRYSWFYNGEVISNRDSIEISQEGTYVVNVTNQNNCVASDTFRLYTSSDLLSSNFVASSEAYIGDTVYLIDVSNPKPDSIWWDIPENSENFEITSNDIEGVLEVLFREPGKYSFTMHSTLGDCYDIDTQLVEVSLPDSLEQNLKIWGYRGAENFVKLFPNPTEGHVTLEFIEGKPPSKIIIKGLHNKQVYVIKESFEEHNKSIDLDISLFSNGVYFLILQSEDRTEIKKVIKT